jgi:hypothetical protein
MRRLREQRGLSEPIKELARVYAWHATWHFSDMRHICYQVLCGHRRGWLDMRDLGAVLDHEEPLPPSG